ncbi:hypothetical protein GIB67_015653 [Kingdonia uniflora]|uniref:Kinesin-like protein n=1 Tax=Kingdonia uniflora TaxID=39325 RepID=A0A7J7NU50_9MAGN|nr:hypothetical protein GIB67_015653 [Kingdonia uniflora]
MKEREVWNVKRDNGLRYKELIETTQALERFKKDYVLKNKECEDTWLSLRELQNELMQKSMHAGSLGNIRVFCRCRPLTVQEDSAGATMAIDFDSAKDGEQDKTSKIPGQDPRTVVKKEESLIDTIALEGVELEVVLGEFDISRNKRVNNKSVKV